MYSATLLLDVEESQRERLLAELKAAAEASGAERWVVAPTLAGSRNGGDILVHLRSTTTAPSFDSMLVDPAIVRINGADYTGSPVRAGEPGGVYRALLLRIHPDAEPAAVARFERELCSMPQFVRPIRAWQLSRVERALGDTAWTHVFEQEFSDLDGLMGAYLMHPIHWAVVDRWFDPETTDCVVRDRVCHSFCAVSHPVL